MDVKEFKALVLEHWRPTLVKLTSERQKINLRDFSLLKALTKSMNFDCQIKEEGGCRSYPDRPSCCCNGCAHAMGYFDMIEYNDLRYYARRFNKDTGFWREGKGCVLPHRKRSVVCVTFHCRMSKKDHEFDDGMSLFTWHLRNLRQKLIDGGKIVKGREL